MRFKDELAEARPEALLGTRRRFLTLAGAATVLALSTRLPGSGTAYSSARTLSGYPFTLGIASGDPLPDSVVLWTRLAPEALVPFGGMPYAPVDVEWELAHDEAFRRIAARGVEVAWPEVGHSVHVDVKGLEPGREYFYRFVAGGERSPIGRTRTAPAAGNGALKFAMVSCQSWHAGFYTAYKHLVNEDVDVVLHLGDYIYEFATDPVGGARNTPIPESAQVPTESLDQYRQRYAVYKTDPDLQAAHAAAPFIVTWDDHEVVNNYADENTTNDQPEAEFLLRRANGYRAYWENMPLRLPSKPAGPDMQLYRRFRYGDLVEFNVLDTRQYRDRQPGAAGQDRFDPTRTILGAEQEQWLLDGLSASPARWNVLAQQVLMAQLDSDPGAGTSIPTDAWDGYAANRIRVADALTQRRISNPVVLCGDVHRHQASHVKGDYRVANAPIVAPEFTCTSISSAGDGSVETPNAANLLRANPHLEMTTSQRGYVTCTVTPDTWHTDFRVVPYITRPGAPVSTHASYAVENGNPQMETA
ncbi:alkaline phosphatase D family protein [Solirubrobacter sp. CPCC 204708]|uniref:Alkaline phosphatase D family protein n=1 Tax=Solirubrobacter deserti TaxID=2282478 RepID=A0ABT4RQ87_9ACTN|nr:alkaline phosphatase D family protein [Solirubrobacter deserti]MBE2320492.1 alkaline phosphatase D family protein [Solirubrobacter deserti]MDA0140738.1 alkaline phosphatase D family protein [Solirubrobacter deserti]